MSSPACSACHRSRPTCWCCASPPSWTPECRRCCADATATPQRPYPTFALAMAVLAMPDWSAIAPAGPLRSWRLVDVDIAIERPSRLAAVADRRAHRSTSSRASTCSTSDLARGARSGRPRSGVAPSQRRVAQAIAAHRRSGVVHSPGPTGPPATSPAVRRRRCRAAPSTQITAPIPLVASDDLARLLAARDPAVAGRALRRCPRPGRDTCSRRPRCTGGAAKPQRRSLVGVREAGGAARRRRVEPRRHDADASPSNAPLAGRLVDARDRGAPGIRPRPRRGRDRQRSTPGRAGASLAARAAHRADGDVGRPCARRRAATQLLHADRRAGPPPRAGLRRLGLRRAGDARARASRALFAGESGTGKTMAAEVLANDLELDLYRIDLAGVVSKYIGETEKNLRRLFDAAEAGGAVLLFDEADALFGKRSEVKRQPRPLRQHRGRLPAAAHGDATAASAILATNMRQRARPRIHAPRCGSSSRFRSRARPSGERIWQLAFPSTVPPRAARSRSGWPGSTSAAATSTPSRCNAAFAAAAAGTPVTMAMVLDAARTELRKPDRPTNEVESYEVHLHIERIVVDAPTTQPRAPRAITRDCPRPRGVTSHPRLTRRVMTSPRELQRPSFADAVANAVPGGHR